MVGELEFEKPVIELRKKIAELKDFTMNADVDLSSEIEKLEARYRRRPYRISAFIRKIPES